MEKTVRIGNIDVKLKANAATPIVYRELFSSDLMVDLSSITTGKTQALDYSVGAQLLYTMALEGDRENTPSKLIDFLSQFESSMDVYMVMPEVLDLWMGNVTTVVKPKKKKDPQNEK